MDTDYCSTCDDYGVCSGIQCPDHPVYDLVIKELDDAIERGICWGDIVLKEEAIILAKESNPAKEMRLKNMAAAQRNFKDGLKTGVVDKCKRRSCEFTGGKHVMKQKLAKKCENVALPDEVLADGSIYPGGCWAHKEGVCPFMHPGEEKIFIFTDNRPIRLVNGKPPVSNATYYSPTQKMETKAPMKSTMEDSW